MSQGRDHLNTSESRRYVKRETLEYVIRDTHHVVFTEKNLEIPSLVLSIYTTINSFISNPPLNEFSNISVGLTP